VTQVALRRLFTGLLVAECLGIGWLVLNPSPATLRSVVTGLSSALMTIGFPDWLASTYLVEFGLNVLLFIPLAALCALLWPRIRLWMWTLGGFALSSALEWLQLELLSQRASTSRDIIANTVGTIVGAGVVCAARWWREATPTRSAAIRARSD